MFKQEMNHSLFVGANQQTNSVSFSSTDQFNYLASQPKLRGGGGDCQTKKYYFLSNRTFGENLAVMKELFQLFFEKTLD